MGQCRTIEKTLIFIWFQLFGVMVVPRRPCGAPRFGIANASRILQHWQRRFGAGNADLSLPTLIWHWQRRFSVVHTDSALSTLILSQQCRFCSGTADSAVATPIPALEMPIWHGQSQSLATPKFGIEEAPGMTARLIRVRPRRAGHTRARRIRAQRP